MNQESLRLPSNIERRILSRLVSAASRDREILEKQIGSCLVRELDEYGSLAVVVQSSDVYDDFNGPLVTAQQSDIDTIPQQGPYINFILFLRSGFINELQIYKDDGGNITTPYDPDAFVLTSEEPRRSNTRSA